MPVEVTGVGDGVALGPEAAFAQGAVAGGLIVDGGLVDFELGGLEKFGADGLIDRTEVAGGGVGLGVDCLRPDVDLVSSSKALGLAVVREVVLVFFGDDLGGEGRR